MDVEMENDPFYPEEQEGMDIGSQPSQRRKRKANDENISPTKRQKGSDESDFVGDDMVAGKILRVVIRNFMCHDNLEVNFNRRINFIIGANGSGKSAILTALTTGLGARARETDRGKSIKDFVKKGRCSATIEIHVSNEGPMAYRYESYGNKIIVIRHINAATGASSYKLKSWRGDKVSDKREELENITNFLNIQVENPISVLNQDRSRSFLVTTNPEDKYKLFMKATRLEYIGDNYKSAQKAAQETHCELEEANKQLRDQEKEIKVLEERLKKVQSLDAIRVELGLLENELKWAHVIKEETKLNDLTDRINNQQTLLNDIASRRNSSDARDGEIDTQIEALKEELSSFDVRASEAEATLEQANESCRSKKNEYDIAKEKLKTLHSNKSRKEKDIKRLENELQKIELEAGRAGDKIKEAREQLEKNEKDLEEVTANLVTKKTELIHLEEDKRTNEDVVGRLGAHYRSLEANFIRQKKRLEALKSQSGDAVSVYGADMPRLVRRIDEEFKRGRFQQKPVGPLGSFIKMRDPRWIPAVESHLNYGTLSTFCVDNKNDARILNIIISEVFTNSRPPSIIISKFFNQVHDVSRNCAMSDDYQNLLDAMEISNPVVANCLIDQRQIECCLLIDTTEAACDALSHASRVPINCKEAITLKGELFYPAPQYRSYANEVHRAKFLQVSTMEAIQGAQEELAKLELELESSKSHWQDSLENLKTKKSEYAGVKQVVDKLQKLEQKLTISIDSYKEQLENTASDPRQNILTEELKVYKQQLEELNLQESVLAQENRTLKTEVDDLNKDLKEKRSLVQNLDAHKNPIKERITELYNEKKRIQIQNQNSVKRLEAENQKMQKLKGDYEQQDRVVESELGKARSVCERIDTTRTIHDITSRIQEIKTAIESIEHMNGSKEEIIAELNEKNEKHAGTKVFAKDLVVTNDKQIERLKARRRLFHEMKREISEKVQKAFTSVLALRSYRGRIKIDHSSKELTLEVSPKNDVKRATNDTRCLSGGERSYSTVAFVLALWQCTGLPFYFLDEFDVFMDKVNRRFIMDILIDFARDSSSQYCFLTPLDTSHIHLTDDITVHRLAPPARA